MNTRSQPVSIQRVVGTRIGAKRFVQQMIRESLGESGVILRNLNLCLSSYACRMRAFRCVFIHLKGSQAEKLPVILKFLSQKTHFVIQFCETFPAPSRSNDVEVHYDSP